MGIFDSFFKKKVNASEPETHSEKGPRYKIGDRIGKRYEIYRILGGERKSGMGVVYVCYDHESKNVYALKTFQEKFFSSKKMKDNFKREALLWIHLERHPFIVRANWVQELDYRMFVGCEFIAPDEQGRNTLTHYLIRPILMKQALTWSIQFCHGMEYACSKGVTPHRDIKPDNIMITRDGIVKITDFGLAGLWNDADGSREFKGLMNEDRKGFTFIKSTGDKVISGTPPWMAPEQFDGKADVRSDIYSFGIVMYQMAAQGELPFYPKNLDDWEIVHKTYSVPEVDSRLFPIIKKCLRKRPEERYQTFRELRRYLELFYRKEINEIPPSPPKPSKFEAWEFHNKGASLANLGLLDEAIKEYREALRIYPEFAETHSNLGSVLSDKGLLDEAIKEYREALRIYPEFAGFHTNLGNVLNKKGLLDEAIKEFREELRINPDFSHTNLGIALDKKGLHNEAIKEFREDLRNDPKDANAHLNLGVALLGKDLLDEAIKEYREALRINSEYAMAHLNLGVALLGKDLLDEAIKEFREALRINPKLTEAHTNLKAALRQKGQLEVAIKEDKEALRINTKDAMVHFNLGVAFRGRGLIDEAIKEFRNALRINPSSALAHFNLGSALSDKSLPDEAIKEYRAALRINPELAEAHYNLGAVFLEKGFPDEAIKEYKEALRIKPEFSEAHYNLGNVFFDLKGLPDEAIKEYRAALRINPELAEAHGRLGAALLQKGLFDEAIKVFENFIRYAPQESASFVEEIKEVIRELKSNR